MSLVPTTLRRAFAQTTIGEIVLAVIVALLIGSLFFMSNGCVLPGDLEDLAAAQRTSEQKVLNALDQRQAGEITEEDLAAAVKKAGEEYVDKVKEVGERVSDRTKEALVPVPVTGNLPIDVLINLAGIFGLYKKSKGDAKREAKREINQERDRARIMRGEVTGAEKVEG